MGRQVVHAAVEVEFERDLLPGYELLREALHGIIHLEVEVNTHPPKFFLECIDELLEECVAEEAQLALAGVQPAELEVSATEEEELVVNNDDISTRKFPSQIE